MNQNWIFSVRNFLGAFYLGKIRFALVGLLFLKLSSCFNSHNLSPPDTITTIVTKPIASLNPLYATDADSQHINDLAHSALVTIGDKLTPVPYLAESIKFINDTTIEFRLREGCKFESGKAITADDVERSLQLFTNPELKSAFLESFKKIKSFKKIDDRTFQFLTEKPEGALLTDLSLLKIVQTEGLDAKAKPTFMRGAGLYRVTSYTPADVTLERNEVGCLPNAETPKVIVKSVRDDISRFLKLKTGEIDIVMNDMNYRKVDLIQHDPSLNLTAISADGIGYNYLGVNQTVSKLKDPRVREAIALSLDIPKIIKYKSRGFAKIARNLLADHNYYANLEVPIIERNLEKARRLLDEAGYYNGQNNKPVLRITLKTTTSPLVAENARAIAAQAKEVGIEIEHRAYEWGIFYADVKTKNTELYLLRYVGVTDPLIYFEVFHSGEISRNNRVAYKNPVMDEWIAKGQGTLDPVKRKQYFDLVQVIAHNDLPFIGLWYTSNTAVFRNDLKNVTLHPSGSWVPVSRMKKGS